MVRIGLIDKTEAQKGRITKYWFENKNIGLKKTLFHRITIPLKKFDSGLEWVEQPEDTEITFEWYEINLDGDQVLDGLNLSHKNYPDAEASVYIGSAHNWCTVHKLSLTKKNGNIYNVSGHITVDFESEGVAKNEDFSFNVDATI